MGDHLLEMLSSFREKGIFPGEKRSIHVVDKALDFGSK